MSKRRVLATTRRTPKPITTGGIVGFIVLCWNEGPDKWAPDWDAELYDTLSEAQDELAKCRAAGYADSILVSCTRVAEDRLLGLEDL